MWLQSLPSTDTFAHQFLEDALNVIHDTTVTTIQRLSQFLEGLKVPSNLDNEAIEIIGCSGNLYLDCEPAMIDFANTFIL